MENKTIFMVFCIEEYKKAGKLTGRQVISLFKKYGVLDYITDCYEALHVEGPAYIVEDIDLFIAARS